MVKTKINVEIKLVGKFPFKWKCRDVYLEAQVKACHPSINDVIGDVNKCFGIALAAAGGAALISSPGAAWPVFKASFYVCIVKEVGDWANAISLSLNVKTVKKKWHSC